MGLAVYNSTILDIHLPRICYRKLLTPLSLPSHRCRAVGIVPVTLQDLDDIMPVSSEADGVIIVILFALRHAYHMTTYPV